MDLGLEAHLPMPDQTRLMGLAKKHQTALLCLTEKDERRPSLGPLISVRVEVKRAERLGDRYRCEVRALKDKRRQPGWTHTEVFHAPDGLC